MGVGQKSCSISVQSYHWKDLPPEGNSKKLFVSLTDREPKDSKVRGLRLGQGVRRKTSAQLATVHLQPSGQQTLSEEAEESLEGIHLVQVEPGQHVAHTEGRCVCIDGEFRCSRSGPGMWHDTDCYYADGESGDYYALGAKWTAHNDACIQCRCLAGRLYACSRTPCHSLFLCPVGQTAVATNGECCPTFCMDIDGASTESKLTWSSNNNSSSSHLTAALERYIRTVTICLILLICIPCVAMCVCCLCPLSKLRVMCAPPKFLSKRRIYQDSGLNTPAISRTANAAVLVASTDLEPITDNLARSQDDGSKWLSSESDGKLASYINGFEGPQPEVKETEHPTVSLTCPSKHASQLTLTASSATSERELRFEKSVHKAEVDPGRADQLAEHQNHAKNEDTRTLLAFASPNRPHRSASTQSRPARPSTSPGGAARETGLRSVQHYFVHLPSVRQRANTMKQQKRFPGADTSCVHTPKVLHASCELPELSPTPPPKPPLPNFHPIDKKNDGGSVFSVKPSHIDFSAMACSLNELTPYCTGV
ncbi:unnamed protein product [Schistocephalus solidus]|uniref:VWFC domain-containing protein n=1 Tax=Schistocephalus solidus TaxID=70667 RepID=A0A183TIW0_SCHSO|nr:unnamed protein product [Schistocephalus solidus]